LRDVTDLRTDVPNRSSSSRSRLRRIAMYLERSVRPQPYGVHHPLLADRGPFTAASGFCRHGQSAPADSGSDRPRLPWASTLAGFRKTSVESTCLTRYACHA
jgi:hypothetical protein